MIEVENLTKRYYDVVAVDGISFDVGKGEVVGFLGPNGAGKSTTLKILTCFIPATSGSARVGGLDVFRQSLKVREQVGYLPENVPLYGDMRVQEYLYYRGRLKGLSARSVKQRIDEVCDLCGLKDMKRRMVGQLSKGYRQRVGLADVLINHPPILFLDEPTAGLDPSQRKEVRDLIARLGTDHTILLSSHILAEVESVCTRVLIIKKGRIIADGKPESLIRDLEGGERVRIEAACPAKDVAAVIARYPEAVNILERTDQEGRSTVLIDPRPTPDFNEKLLYLLVTEGIPIREFVTRRYTLEEIFIHLTVEDEVLSDMQARDGGIMKRFVSNTLILTWREIESTFYSPLSFIVLTMFLVLNGFSFYVSLPDVQYNVSDAVRNFLGLNIIFWLGALFIPPMITMRLIAEEKKSGTIEPLMTAPVSDLQVVLAKYFGAMIFFIFLWTPSLLYIVIIKRYGGIPDNGVIFSSYAGIFLLGSGLIALGLFTSSLSQNQIVAAVIALVLNLLVFFVPMLSLVVHWDPVRRVLDQLWIYKHFEETFTKGMLDSFHLVFYLGLTAFFMFLTVRSLEARKWH